MNNEKIIAKMDNFIERNYPVRRRLGGPVEGLKKLAVFYTKVKAIRGNFNYNYENMLEEDLNELIKLKQELEGFGYK